MQNYVNKTSFLRLPPLVRFCHGFVCSLWLWYFLIMLTYYFLVYRITTKENLFFRNVCTWYFFPISFIGYIATKHRLKLNVFDNCIKTVFFKKIAALKAIVWKHVSICIFEKRNDHVLKIIMVNFLMKNIVTTKNDIFTPQN